MGVNDILVACVGKPSAGKSSLLNAISEASAKVGNFPFTTIKPNHGVAYVQLDCPCAKYNKQLECKPRQGSCKEGKRLVPLQILDVAGLIPGASEGAVSNITYKGIGKSILG
jgi:ribosome-binding ATPase YchF (GTP1/OBG family)